jgi:hypothetical protein
MKPFGTQLVLTFGTLFIQRVIPSMIYFGIPFGVPLEPLWKTMSIEKKVWYSVRSSVAYSIRSSVFDSVRGSVRGSVHYHFVWISIRDSIEIFLNDYNYEQQ